MEAIVKFRKKSTSNLILEHIMNPDTTPGDLILNLYFRKTSEGSFSAAPTSIFKGRQSFSFLQHLSRSTRFLHVCTALNSKWRKILQDFWYTVLICYLWSKSPFFRQTLMKMCRKFTKLSKNVNTLSTDNWSLNIERNFRFREFGRIEVTGVTNWQIMSGDSDLVISWLRQRY